MTPTLDTPVGEIARDFPLTTRVFARFGIDYCCGGSRPLKEACSLQGVESTSVLHDLEQEIKGHPPTETNWKEAPLTELIDHILAVHHVPLYPELDRLLTMATKVHEVHGHRDPQGLSELVNVVAAVREDLIPHMHKEEQILFPMIRNGQGRMTGGPVNVMHVEHEEVGALLRRLRELTNDYQVPAEACNTWLALWHGLKALEEDLHLHIHLENNVLFPRALAG